MNNILTILLIIMTETKISSLMKKLISKVRACDQYLFMGKHPDHDKPVEFSMSKKRLDRTAKDGIDFIYTLAESVKEVVWSPDAIFYGLKREEDIKFIEPDIESVGLCYVGRPKKYFRNSGDSTPWPKNSLLGIFITDQFRIFRFGPVKDVDVLNNWEHRFTERIYHRKEKDEARL